MEAFLEIMKYTIPAVVVFATSFTLLKQLLEDKQNTMIQAQRNDALKLTLPIRLQAYERLLLVCDRVAVQNVLLRLRMPGMTVAELRGAMLLSIRQEFDHNTSQQLYVSDTLWQIISFAKNETMSFISQAADGLDPQASDAAFVDALLIGLDQDGYASPLLKAIIAIRTEAGQLF